MAKILIVEDDVDLVETYTDLLLARGHSVLCASRMSEAIAYVSEMEPDIVTLDLSLPGGSGSAISSFVHTTKTCNQCGIIIISGHTERMSGQDWVDEVDLILTKPVENQHLMMMIDRLLTL